jgi:NitT/TauT family transport system ATP-binding protein
VTHDVDEALFLSDRVYAMSSRPGRVTQILDVAIPRPRDYDVITSQPFIEMKQVLLAQLRLAHGPGRAA